MRFDSHVAGMKDIDYLTLFIFVFIPIVREVLSLLVRTPFNTQFDPDLIIVSAGFDCADGDTLGPMKLSPDGPLFSPGLPL